VTIRTHLGLRGSPARLSYSNLPNCEASHHRYEKKKAALEQPLAKFADARFFAVESSRELARFEHRGSEKDLRWLLQLQPLGQLAQ